jgi:two-component system CheB/CheR fusion protein
LRSALRRAADTNQPVERENVLVQFDGGVQSIILTIEILPGIAGERLFLVVFADDERAPVRGEGSAETHRPMLQDLTIEQLERELRDVREQNQSIAEEYETALEELKSANEELHSVNEELQSSNEELETSKEEIQSVNEELQTVNYQLTNKVDELDRASSDLRNLFESTRVPTVFLDYNLTIRSFTPAIAGLYSLIASDRGRPLTDIVCARAYDDLRADVAQVLTTLEPVEKRVERRDGQAHYLMRVLPYRSSEQIVEGVLVTFNDVTSIVRAEQHDKVLVDELNHRVKNMLTVVISLATQTKRVAVSFDAFWNAFMGRMQALSNAYALLSRDHWTDIPLRDVLNEELKTFMESGQNSIAMSGPDLSLRPKYALAFGLVLHELATNAVRHGALSVAGGHVTIGWTIEGNPDAPVMAWQWHETDGPSVSAPAHRGFGIALIERSLAHELNGSAELDFLPAGFNATLTIPFDSQIVTRGPIGELRAP